jgi:hypothetical protein
MGPQAECANNHAWTGASPGVGIQTWAGPKHTHTHTHKHQHTNTHPGVAAPNGDANSNREPDRLGMNLSLYPLVWGGGGGDGAGGKGLIQKANGATRLGQAPLVPQTPPTPLVPRPQPDASGAPRGGPMVGATAQWGAVG